MRLAHNSRPAYVPLGMTLADVDSEMKKLEGVERERQVALQQELSRQLRLLNLFNQHTKHVGKLTIWCDVKSSYLKEREDIDSVSAATLSIRRLDAHDKEYGTVMMMMIDDCRIDQG